MSAPKYAPGTVRVAKYPDEQPKRFMYQRAFGTDQYRGVSAEGTTSIDFSAAEWTHALVALDLEDVDRAIPLLREAVENMRRSGLFGYTVLSDIADQIEAQTWPPKPTEPTGLGAVVEDAEGTDWHRTREGRWIAADGLRTQAGGWGHIDAVRVLSEGVIT